MVQLGSPTLDTPGCDLPGIFVGPKELWALPPELRCVSLSARSRCRRFWRHLIRFRPQGKRSATSSRQECCRPQWRSWMRWPLRPEAAVHAHYPVCNGLLLVELDGPCNEVDVLMKEVRNLCLSRGARGFASLKPSRSARLFGRAVRPLLRPWVASRPTTSCRMASFPVPRCRLMLSEIDSMASAAGLRVANVFHAGDGNLHPLVLYDASISGQEETALDVSYRILRLCVDNGGSITGEHGVGKEKQEVLGYMFSEPDLATMQLVRCAFDPDNIANPDKVFPRPGSARRSRGSMCRIRWRPRASRRSFNEPNRNMDAGRGCGAACLDPWTGARSSPRKYRSRSFRAIWSRWLRYCGLLTRTD